MASKEMDTIRSSFEAATDGEPPSSSQEQPSETLSPNAAHLPIEFSPPLGGADKLSAELDTRSA